MSSEGFDLFSSSNGETGGPLAHRMRPRTLDEFTGQEHIVGPGRLLRRAIQADQLSSLIFYGPPGTGKTTLARVIANTTRSAFLSLNAVLSGVKEVRASIEEAKQSRDLYGRKTILFVDEVHRWNRAQQDALLPWVENGTVILIGATTENPYFEVNSALVSRSRIFQLKPLDEDDLFRIARITLEEPVRGYGKYRVTFAEGALEHLVNIANGDARTLLNALELAIETTPAKFPPSAGEEIHVDLQTAEESIQKKVVLYDKEGDYHFDTISAFIKSIRGSDPDAALYWLARMIQAGEDPRFILRRLIISASEDIGLANPMALVVAEAAAAAYERIGLPEGNFPLTQATLYLATSPKSNSALGFFDALSAVQQERSADVPGHLRDANRDKEAFGHGAGYLYPHAYRDHWVAQQYLPGGLQGRVFYKPSAQGYEADIRDQVNRRREAQLAAMLETEETEVLTWTPRDRDRDRWLDRIEGGRSGMLLELRQKTFEGLNISRHDRILVAGESGSGLFLWEAYRRTPEGGQWATVPSQRDFSILSHFAESLPEAERPVLIEGDFADLLETPAERRSPLDGPIPGIPADVTFETVIGRNLTGKLTDKLSILSRIPAVLAPGGVFRLSEVVPRYGQRLSSLLEEDALEPEWIERLHEAEHELYHAAGNPLVNWTDGDLEELCRAAGFSQVERELVHVARTRNIHARDVENWFESGRQDTGYGPLLSTLLTDEAFAGLKNEVYRQLNGKTVAWKSSWVILTAKA